MINIKMHENLITLSHLPAVLHETNEEVQMSSGKVLDVSTDSLNLESCTEAFEKAHIAKVLEMNQNNREYTARELGISLRTLYYKLKKLGIND